MSRRAWCTVGCLLLAACGDDGPGGTARPDADRLEPVDAARDASEPAAPIAVTVYRHGTQAPLMAAEVQFVAPGGTVTTVTTDGDGVARGPGLAGTSVLVVQRDRRPPVASVFVGVGPGAEVVVGRRPPASYPVLGTITFALPVRAGAAAYDVAVSCGTKQANPRAFRVTACPEAGAATAVAWALDASGAVISGASVRAGLDLAALAGTTLTMPAYGAQPAAVTSAITGVPAGAVDARWTMSYLAGSDLVAGYAWSSPPAPQMAIVAAGERTVATLQYQPDGFGPLRFDRVSAGQQPSFAVDASEAIRAIADVAYDPATAQLSWREATIGRPATAVGAVIDVGDGAAARLRIELHAPHDPSLVVQLPALPGDLAPTAADRIVVEPSFHLVEGASYAQLLPTLDTYLDPRPSQWGAAFTGSVWLAQ